MRTASTSTCSSIRIHSLFPALTPLLPCVLLPAAYSEYMSLNDMSLKRTMLAAECPIQFCKSGRDCIYSSRTKKWRCTSCTSPRIPNAAKSECVVSGTLAGSLLQQQHLCAV
jgi:hypothetical protein